MHLSIYFHSWEFVWSSGGSPIMIQCQIHMSFTVAENTESVDNPLHDAAKRGNIEFMNECLTNRVSLSVTTYTNCY